MDIYAIVSSGFAAVYDYVLAHTLFCLVPAFFIAGCNGGAHSQRPAPAVPRERLAKAYCLPACPWLQAFYWPSALARSFRSLRG